MRAMLWSVCYGACLEVRGQVAGAGSLLPRCGSQVIRFGAEYVYPLHHSNSPEYLSYRDTINMK